MQLDNTRIAIRERGVLDSLDLALHVTRAYAGPLALTMLFCVIPLMVVNHFLIGWMVPANWDQSFAPADFGKSVRYVWTMVLLVFLEAPLASIFATAYLGQAVFLERPKISKIVSDALSLSGRLFWCVLVMRGILLGWVLVWNIDRRELFSAAELALIFYCMVLAGIRSARPFLVEIVLLERNPLRAADPQAMTIRRRSSLLHAPSGGDLLGRWIGSTMIAVLLGFAVFGTMVFLSGVFFYDWVVGPVMLQFTLPFSLWIVVAYMTVFRFLSYLDLRIRQEGWEVELQMRAEAARLNKLPV